MSNIFSFFSQIFLFLRRRAEKASAAPFRRSRLMVPRQRGAKWSSMAQTAAAQWIAYLTRGQVQTYSRCILVYLTTLCRSHGERSGKGGRPIRPRCRILSAALDKPPPFGYTVSRKSCERDQYAHHRRQREAGRCETSEGGSGSHPGASSPNLQEGPAGPPVTEAECPRGFPGEFRWYRGLFSPS